MKNGLSQWAQVVQSASSTNEMIQRRIVKELRKVLHFRFAKIIGLVKVNGNSRLQQYKQLEAQKMIVVDTIMNSYGGSQSAGHHLWNDNLTEKDRNIVYADVR